MNRDPNNRGHKAPPVLILIVYMLLLPDTVFAYLDMQTGSYLLQLFIGGVFGLVLTVKLFWEKIATWFSRVFLKRTDNRKHE